MDKSKPSELPRPRLPDSMPVASSVTPQSPTSRHSTTSDLGTSDVNSTLTSFKNMAVEVAKLVQAEQVRPTLMKAVEANARAVDGEASRMVSRLKAAVERLLALPGKTQTKVDGANSETLWLQRHGAQWNLVFTWKDEESGLNEGREWHECSLIQKATIASLLPQLLKSMKSQSEAVLVSLQKASAALDELDATLSDAEAAAKKGGR